MKIPYLKIIGGAIPVLLLLVWMGLSHSNSETPETILASVVNSEEGEVEVGLSEVEQILAESSPVDEAFLEALKTELGGSLNQPNIAREDILRGWYQANKNEKRYGTPENWVFSERDGRSIWGDPYTITQLNNPLKDRCEAAGAQYVESCLETTNPSCEFVEKSYCQCGPEELWDDNQGCIPHPDF